MNFQPPDPPDYGHCLTCNRFIHVDEKRGDNCIDCDDFESTSGAKDPEFNRHTPNGARRPARVKKDSIVHAKGGGQEIIQRADRVDWRNVSSWAYTDKPATPIVNYAHCDGECD